MNIPKINSKILLSGASIAAAAALVVGATFAFFSDTETSTGNTFVAGNIDLQIDNTSYVTDANGNLVASSPTSWIQSDLTVQKFFNFSDVKPGDIGEDTISIHVGSNDAWLCAAAQITDDSDQTCTEPEVADDPSCANPGLGLGELDQGLNFAFWKDDGDNVFETGQFQTDPDVDGPIFLSGPLSGLGTQGKIALVDNSGGPFGPSPVPGNSTSYIGKAWCFGTLTPAAVAQDGSGTDGPLTGSPTPRGTGFTCEGSGVDNAAQTDQVIGDLQFYAEQSRNNDQFDCDTNYTPVWPSPSPSPSS